VSAGDRSPFLGFIDDAQQWPRWAAFERIHPNTTFGRVGDMTQACVVDNGEETTVTRPTLRELIDALEEIFG
jgi:hypothetical protein